MHKPNFTVQVSEVEGQKVVSAAGELDAFSADDLREVMSQVLRDKPRRVIVDLSRVSFLDSGAIQVLVGACHQLGGPSRLCAVASGRPEEVLRMAGLDRLMDVRRTLDEARAAGESG